MRFWRNTSVATLAAGADRDAAGRHARLRVGRGPRQRRPARPAWSTCRRRPSTASRRSCRTTARPYGDRHGHAQPDALPASERRARLRRRHRAVVLGPRRRPRPRQLDRRPAHAAGDGQPASPTWARSRRTLQAGLVAATASTDTAAPTATITSPAAGATVTPRHDGHHHRHGDRHRRRRRRRRRGLDRWRRDLASRPAGARAGRYTWTPAATGQRHAAGARRRRQRQPRLGDLGDRHASAAPQLPVQPLRRPSPRPRPTNDNQAIEVGVRFRADVDGFITGLRFYGAGVVGAARRPPVDRRRHAARLGHLRRATRSSAGTRSRSRRPCG